MELNDKKLKELLSHSKLELPFADFERRMMSEIKTYEQKKKVADRNRLYSYICFLVGVILGTILTYLLSQRAESLPLLSSYQEYIDVAIQIIYLFLIVLFADKLWKLTKFDFKELFKSNSTEQY